jgi:lysozyme
VDYYLRLVPMLKQYEGTGPIKNDRLMPYVDTVGKTTVGYGRNLTDRGVSTLEADTMLYNDIKVVEYELNKHLPWWNTKPENVQLVLLNMCFNLGISRLLLFDDTLRLIHDDKFAEAAEHIAASLWHKQVGKRAIELEALLRTISNKPNTPLL